MGWRSKLAVLLVGCILLGTMTGCGKEAGTVTNSGSSSETGGGKETKEEMSIVNIHLPRSVSYTEDGIQKVEDTMNEIMAERYGVQVNLNYIELGNWTVQSNMAMTTDECDVIAVVNTPLSSFVNNGQLLALNNYYENATDEMKAQFNDAQIAATTFNGNLYSLPNIWWAGNESTMFMSKKICDEMGIDPLSINSIETAEELLYKVHEAYPDIYTLVPGVNASKLIDTWYLGDGVNTTDNKYGVVPIFDTDFDENDMKVESVFATEAFMNIAKRAYQWNQDGLVLPDVISNTIDGRTYIKNDQAFAFITRQSGTGYKKSSAEDAWYKSAPLGPLVGYSASIGNISYGISSNSNHKDDAWTVLQALYSDPEIATLFIEGIEGVNYQIMEDGTAAFVDGEDMSNSTYGGIYQFWLAPNTTIVPPSTPVGTGFAEALNSYNEDLMYSPVIGFKWDSTENVDEITAVVNIYDQYYNALLAGVIDPEETIPQVLEQLKSAGMDKILESQQQQLDEFLKSK